MSLRLDLPSIELTPERSVGQRVGVFGSAARRRIKAVPSALVLALALMGCTERKTAPSTQPAEEESPALPPTTLPSKQPEPLVGPLGIGALVAEKNGVRVSKLRGSPDFPEAKLALESPSQGASVKPTTRFDFRVTGYELGVQTLADPMLAASDKGQHIHFIIDNQPYLAEYEPSFEADLGKGSHIIIAFLSRSYHESIKHDHVLTRVHVGPKTKKMEEIDLEKDPLLFYSRPKGSYTGEGAKNILLDFYLVNTDLSPDGKKVEATINGEKFVLTEWVPYVVEGLPMGENTFRLRLVNEEGKLVTGPFNEITRTITLQEG